MYRALRLAVLLALPVSPSLVFAGGPRLVAGSTWFDPGVLGHPIRWATGQIDYYVDQGPLSNTVGHQQAVAMVDAAAGLWSGVSTAAVALVDKGSLGEDVSGLNAVPGMGGLQQPSDVAATATAYPVGVLFDADGSVIDAVLGSQTSDPASCATTGVVVWTDNIRTDATLAHAVIVLNGRCTDTDNRLKMMNFLLERAFGLVLGLGHAQVYPHALTEMRTDEGWAWPVMQPQSGSCGQAGGSCIPTAGILKYDDIAELNRLYPVTSDNQAAFPGKLLTAANTVSLQGAITFRAGAGMQGVNVVAVPLDANGDPLVQYTVTAVTGALFSGNHGSPVVGWNDRDGTPLSRYGSTDPSLQGTFDLRFMPLPPGMTAAAYQVSFEPIDPLNIMEMAVGPYYWGSPLPSGTLAPISVPALAAGGAKTLTVNVANSAAGDSQDAISTEEAPRLLVPSGYWSGRLSQVGQTDWFDFPVRGNRLFTVATQAVDERGIASASKAMPSLGIWDAFDAVGAPSLAFGRGQGGSAWLRVATEGDDIVRIAVADARGDGRPDYAYKGLVLYADSVEPQRLPSSGGPIVIRGMGFRANDTVLVGGRPAHVTSIYPNEITAIAPAAASGVTGSVDIEVDDQPVWYSAMIGSGVSYDAATGDTLVLVTAPANTIPIGVPAPFSVIAIGADLQPAGGVTVTYRVSSGSATLGCGSGSCSVRTAGDGSATMNLTAVDGQASVVTASLGNGSRLQTSFKGGTPPSLAALTPSLSVAAGATVTWTAQALVLKSGVPQSGQIVAWQPGTGMSTGSSPSATSGANGVASKALTVGPLTSGQLASASACLNGTSQCVSFNAAGASPAQASLEAISGTSQTLGPGDTAALVILRVRDAEGNPMAGALVTLSQAVYAWAPPCPPHGRCTQSELLSNQTATAISGIDGTVSFSPATLPGLPTNTLGIAATGDTSTVMVTLELHP